MNGMPVTSQTGRTPDPERRFGYRRRIRGTMYIWGSAGITSNLHFPSPLILYLRNDVFGEPVTISTETADGSSTTIGTLGAGEYLSIPIQDIRGISATCDLESTVSCMLSGDHGECFVALEPNRMDPDQRPNSF
jgi:hypothetical protein